MSKFKYAVLGVAAAVLSPGCASEQPARSYVQPNIIKKTDLLGTDPSSTPIWYYLQTVTDAPPTNGSLFKGQSSDLMKIRFQIEEDTLYAVRAYAWVENSEDYFWRDPAHYEGQPLAAWHIDKQFDIIRDYNSTTGEQTNKIIESTERPWQDREFIRVDWSMNLVTDYVGIGLDFFFSDGQPRIEPVSYWESDPTKPDAMHWERFDKTLPHATDDGFKDGEATYFDITNMIISTPEQMSVSYTEGGVQQSFSIPKCFLRYYQDDCASQKVKVRHAFAKLAPQHEYVPRDWDGLQMNLFGVWDIALRRLTYNRQYGVTNSGFKRHAARFNIWKKSYTTDAMGNKVPMPYAQREVKPIPYYADGSQPTPVPLGNNVMTVEGRYPEDLYPQFADIVKQWDDAMRETLSEAATMDDGMGGTTRKWATADAAPHVFIPCHNPVLLRDKKDSSGNVIATKDDAGCLVDLAPDMDPYGNFLLDANGDKIYRAREGDPRHSRVFWINEQQNAGPLGYGPAKYDEETGESLSGQAYIYGAALDTYAARSRDLMLLQNGEFVNSDFTNGLNVQAFVTANKVGASQKPPTFSPDQVLAMKNAMDFGFAKGFTAQNGYPRIDLSSVQALYQSLASREDAIYGNFFGQVAQGASRDINLTRLMGTPLEKMMITTENVALASNPRLQWDQMTPLDKAQVSPIRIAAFDQANELERVKAETLGVDFATFDDAGLQQRLDVYLNNTAYCPNGPTNCSLALVAEQLRQDMRKDIYEAVTLHEVGHNMGCRHNFRASYDAMNYFPDYWQIRTDAISNPDPGMGKADGKLHPRWVNVPGGAVTQYETQKGVREFQYSSIMDYGAEFNSDLKGLGLYDKALIKFSYGELLEVFTAIKQAVDSKGNPIVDGSGNPVPDPAALAAIAALHQGQTAMGFPSPLATGQTLASVDYHTYPDIFQGGFMGIYQRDAVPRTQISTSNGVQVDALNRPIVPYYFCSDEFVGNLTCQRFDAGPDPYEQATDLISRYQNFYLYNNFKRDRQTFHTTTGYQSRIRSRYFEMLREQLTWYVLLRSDFENFEVENCQLQNGSNCQAKVNDAHSFLVDEKGWGGFTVAVSLGFDLLAKTISTPNLGSFYRGTDDANRTLWKQFNDDPQDGATLPPNLSRVSWLDGKYINTIWDYNNCGYYWADECQLRIGYMVDKQVALDVLAESQAYFTGRDTNTDVRQYAIGYIVPFKKQIEEKFGAIFANDYSSLSPYISNQVGGPRPTYRSWLFDNPVVPPAYTGDLLDPSTGFTVQLYAGVYGLASFPTTFDHDFIDHTQIFVVGNGEASFPDSQILAVGVTDPTKLVGNGGAAQWFLYTDAESGKIFAAHSVPPEVVQVPDSVAGTGGQKTTPTAALRLDSGVRMLEHLKTLGDILVAAQALPMSDPTRDAKVSVAKNNYDLYKENVEIMRSLHNAFGYGQYKTDAPFYL